MLLVKDHGTSKGQSQACDSGGHTAHLYKVLPLEEEETLTQLLGVQDSYCI